jgi:hypothetical protein
MVTAETVGGRRLLPECRRVITDMTTAVLIARPYQQRPLSVLDAPTCSDHPSGMSFPRSSRGAGRVSEVRWPL